MADFDWGRTLYPFYQFSGADFSQIRDASPQT